MLIYFDTCCYPRPFNDKTQLRVRAESDAVLRILDFCERGGAGLIISDALKHETGY